MIQKSLMELLKLEITGLNWSIDYRTAKDNTGTVYSTGGRLPDEYEAGLRYPTYQVFIRSSDWDYAKAAAYIVFNKLHKKNHFRVTESYVKDEKVLFTKNYYIYLIEAMSEPICVGPLNNIMEYSVNFDVTLKEE